METSLPIPKSKFANGRLFFCSLIELGKDIVAGGSTMGRKIEDVLMTCQNSRMLNKQINKSQIKILKTQGRCKGIF
jgi:hypothetical protein